jgi:Domain of unknown function(DUF2779)
MATATRYLTKSRFKMAMECPTKLAYSGKRGVYADKSLEDDFLAMLAEGGYQVGALAKVMHPDGIEVTETNHATALARTRELLSRERVTIFEAAIAAGDLFVRVDILRKDGTTVELIEVKAKSYDPADTEFFVGKYGGFKPAMLPYLQDIAFQRYVFGLAFPDLAAGTSSFLMLADKSKISTVEQLSQKFRIRRVNGRPMVHVAPGTDVHSIGAPLLAKVPVGQYVSGILAGELEAPGINGPFSDVVQTLADAYVADQKLPPVLGVHCHTCQFRRGGKDNPNLLDGRHECWTAHGVLAEALDGQRTVLDLWNYRSKSDLIAQRRYLLSDITADDLKVKAGDAGLSRGERQWMQASGDLLGQNGFYLDRDVMREAMGAWKFPLHFIDFETTRVAIPFSAGQRPYGNVAFQFSHHIVDADGAVAHRSQYINTTPGVHPNYYFARALMEDLGGDNGAVFRWSHHENTVLNGILDELAADTAPPADAEELRHFLLSLTVRGKGGKDHRGARAMVDLCDLAEKAFFHPSTAGSSSIKKVLPAVMRESACLRARYSLPIYGVSGGIPSLNWKASEQQMWWAEVNGRVLNPYDMLPPVFLDMTMWDIAGLEFDADLDMEIREGGAAMTAYARLQFEELDPELRLHIEHALQRYCELDTLAMVMIYEAWREWCR